MNNPLKIIKNVVIVSECEYNELMKAKRNVKYLGKIDKSVKKHERGDTISFTVEELRAMEAD